MKSKFNEKHAVLLKAIDPEIANFYRNWLRLRESDDFAAIVNLLAHLARRNFRRLAKSGVKEEKSPKTHRENMERYSSPP